MDCAVQPPNCWKGLLEAANAEDENRNAKNAEETNFITPPNKREG
jgi:hypothetical protein